MTVELVDGHAGTPHIASDDLARIHQGLYGNQGDFVLPNWGTGLQCSKQSDTRYTVGTGVGSIGGLHFTNTATETVSIDPGTSGQTRHDIIAAVYERGSDGVESVSLQVFKGAPSYGSAYDPSVPQGDVTSGASRALPLWRISLNGTSAGQPEKMFSELTLGHASGSDAVKDISPEFQSWALNWEIYYTAILAGPIVTVSVRATKTGNADWHTTSDLQKAMILKFPDKYAPYWTDLHFPAATTWSTTTSLFEWNVNNSKDSEFGDTICLRVMGPTGTKVAMGSTVSGSFSWGIKGYQV